MSLESSDTPPPSPPSSRGPDLQPNHAHPSSTAPDSVPPSSDGRTPQTAQYSLVLVQNPDEEFTYIIYHLGLNRWVRTIANEARIYAGYGYAVLDGSTYRTIAESDWVQGVPAAHCPVGAEFELQDAEVDCAEQRFANPVAEEAARSTALDEGELLDGTADVGEGADVPPGMSLGFGDKRPPDGAGGAGGVAGGLSAA